MPAASSGSDDARPHRAQEPEARAIPRVNEDLSPFLERILSETHSEEGSDSISSEEMSALVAVAVKYRGESLNLQPIGRELVQAVLELHPFVKEHSGGKLDQMSAEVAAVLFDDPWARGRLLSLWTRLSEACR